jgi:hypothetical protein
MINLYNVYSGETYKLREEELKNTLEGEIPLTKSPKTSCKKCYGRGHIGRDRIKQIYQPCTNCVEKCVLKDYETKMYFNYIKFTDKPV